MDKLSHMQIVFQPNNGETSRRAKKYHEQLVKARNLKNMERTETKTWFGHKVFKSLLIAPCRKCEAVQPGAIKGQIVSQ
jgi:hypothetical protein